MDYHPVTGVWEITMGCNMHCMHCGSACSTALPDELTSDEALQLCDQIGELGFKWITLSGGEPTTRPDWDRIAARLRENGVIPNLITNGWFVDTSTVKRAQDAGINTMAISVDGLRETHDYIRKAGSFDRIMHAFDLLAGSPVHSAAITTVNARNCSQLSDLLALLEDKGVGGWQLQIGLPMGNMAGRNELVAGPESVDTIINFAHEHYRRTRVDLQLADCIGYYNVKEMEVRQKGDPAMGYGWSGCGAGKTSLGILHDGSIVGCTSIRNPAFIEGSVREHSLRQLWESPTAFKWNRLLRKEHLTGFCSRCKFGAACLGGCGNMRLVMSGSVFGDNHYCSYHTVIAIAEKQFSRLTDISSSASRARSFIANDNLQLAECLLRRSLTIQNDDRELLGLYGFVSYMLQNYDNAMAANHKALRLNDDDPYANKGMGLTLCKLGNIDAGIFYLRKAVRLADKSFMDPYHDLAVILLENGRTAEARNVLDEGKRISPAFFEKNRELYEKATAE